MTLMRESHDLPSYPDNAEQMAEIDSRGITAGEDAWGLNSDQHTDTVFFLISTITVLTAKERVQGITVLQTQAFRY